MDNRKECSYKDKCYRKKYEHFEQFCHPHLDELLEKIGSHEIHVPFGYVPNISFATIKAQLEIERKVKAELKSRENEPDVKRIRVNSQTEANASALLDQDNYLFIDNLENNSSASPSNKNRNRDTPSKGNILGNFSTNLQQDTSKSNENLNRSRKSTSRNSGVDTPGPSSTDESSSLQSSPNPSQPGPSKKTFEKQKVSARHSANMREAEAFRNQVQSQINMNIGDKLRAAFPYNILYTSLQSNPNNTSDRLTVTFPELLDSPLGLLEDSLLINFMVQFGWILACYFTMGHSNKPMTLLYGETDIEFGTKFNRFLKYAKIKPPSAFGSHHTKMMIYQYLDKSIRVVVCTANLVESDWTNKTQGVWISDKCEEMLPGETGGESKTNFKRDLLAYLQSYNQSVLDPWIQKVQNADMSHINVFFIGSIPGSHKVVEGKWGQARLRSVLKSHAPVVENNSYKVILQISSIGSLGPNPDSWLLNDILTTFSSTKPSSSLLSRPSVSVVYPSFENVASSADGLLSGGCLPYSSTTHRKQEWLINYLNNWKSDAIGRTKAVPHIKSYTRVSADHSRISYFLLTSANLSKAAWGTISKAQSINILSYEAGVLFLPEFILGDGDYFPLKEASDSEGGRRPRFQLPYDLPLVPYGDNDVPWFIDNLPL